MAGENLNRDQNFVTVIGAITNDSAQDVRMIRVDPMTNRVLVSAGSGGLGTVTSVSVVSVNGFAGTVATATTTPAITLSTTVTGLLKGNGTSVSAAVSNSDYQAPIVFTTSGTSGASTFDGTNLNIPNYAGGVTSVFSRSGAVTAQSGDYTTLLVTENTNLYFTNARAIASTLTGYASGSGTVSSADSILSAIQKLNGNTAALVTGVSSVNSLTGAVALTGTANRITVSAANVFDISALYVGQSSITTLGTITTGVWNGTAIANANLANSTISGVALGGTLAALTATDSTLTFSGSYTGTTARTVGLNLGNANTWTALQSLSTNNIANTSTDGLVVQNTTAALVGAQLQWSPRIRLSGTAWNTTNLNSETDNWIIENQTTAANPTQSNLLFSSSIAGGAYSARLTLTNGGNVLIGGNVTMGNSTNSALWSQGATVPSSTTQIPYLFGGASTVYVRTGVSGVTSTLGANSSYGAFVVASAPITAAASGTHAWLTNVTVNPLGTVTNGSAIPITNSATLYVGAASSAASTNYSAYIDTGNVKLNNGNLTLGTAGNALFITEGSNGRVGQVALVSGTKAITITGITTGSRAFITLVSPAGTTLTVECQAVCTANTLTIQANVAAGTINTADTSTYNYFVIN